jgi:magnesium transporter
MLRKLRGFVQRAGRRPGYLPETRLEGEPEVRLIETVIRSDGVTETELSLRDVIERGVSADEPEIRWLRVIGVHDGPALEQLGQILDLSRLELEDIANIIHRPKVEVVYKHVFTIAKMMAEGDLDAEDPIHLAIQLSGNRIVSFEDREAVLFGRIYSRIRETPEIFLERGSSYLYYALLDAAVDSAFGLVEATADSLMKLERRLENRVRRQELLDVYRLRRQLILLRQWILPLRDVIRTLHGGLDGRIGEPARTYFGDVLDHIEQLLDAEEVHDRLAEAMISTHISASGQHSTAVMQTLTVIATIFIPLTFIVGVYGMNFDVMPELHWKYGYFAVWGIMLAVVGVQVYSFRRRGWF